MSPLPEAVREQLEFIAHEILEVFASEGHDIVSALDANPAFRQNGRETEGALTRDLLRQAINDACSGLVDVTYRSGRGSARRIEIVSGVRRLIFKLRAVEETDTGAFRIVAGDSDPLAGLECEALIQDEAWVIGYGRDREPGGLPMLMAAQVMGKTDEIVSHLVLENAVRLTGNSPLTPPPTRFAGSSDDLEGFEFDAEEDGTGGWDV